jgi:hypothetical protein
MQFRERRRNGEKLTDLAKEAGCWPSQMLMAVRGVTYADVPGAVPPRKTKKWDMKRTTKAGQYARELTEKEWEDFKTLRGDRTASRDEVLRLIGREDLIEKYPSPGNHKGPRKCSTSISK